MSEHPYIKIGKALAEKYALAKSEDKRAIEKINLHYKQDDHHRLKKELKAPEDAMKKAENDFNEMKEISKELQEAFSELLKKNPSRLPTP